ncbi:MAG TPA: tripartite tricarboxylate transporter TctB family protein [Actinomycetales bacterium]|jgi:hypothetical protein|nr:tripartite tricarboxylate transporter TctB family protein [Actinomycetales bacterium]
MSSVDPAAGRTVTGAASGTESAGKRLVTTETAVYAVLALVGVYMALSSFGLGLRTNGAWIGPGTMPLVVGGLLCMLAGALLVKKVRTAASSPAPSTEAGDDDDLDIFGRTSVQRVRQLWIVVAALAAAIALVPLLGFAFAFAALVLFIATVVERQRLLVAVVITAVSLIAVHLIFVMFLNVPLPQGMLGVGF